MEVQNHGNSGSYNRRFKQLSSQSQSLPSTKLIDAGVRRDPNHNNSGFFFAARSCSSCANSLGFFLSRGYSCRRCGHKICKKCKVYDDESSWVCVKCAKNHLNVNVKLESSKLDGRNGSSRVKRSWSISAPPTRSSPILKSYVRNEEKPQFQFHSLPRMSWNKSQNQGSVRRAKDSVWLGRETTQLQSQLQSQSQSQSQSLQHVRNPTINNNTNTPHFQSTLHPFTVTHVRKSPSSSINFIEDEYWDYYDYDYRSSRHRPSHSNRSSCERSLGETVEFGQQVLLETTTPKKPARRKCKSLGSYDVKYSQLKTYCLISKRRDCEEASTAVERSTTKDVADKSGSTNDETSPTDTEHGFVNDSPPTPLPRKKALTQNKASLQKDQRFHIFGGTLPKDYKQRVVIGEDSSASVNVNVKEAITGRVPVGLLSEVYSSLPPDLNCTGRTGTTAQVDDDKTAAARISVISHLMNLPYGNSSCSCDLSQCNLPAQISTNNENETTKLRKATKVVTEQPLLGQKLELEGWRAKLRKMKEDYNALNNNVISCVDKCERRKREVIIPIKKEFQLVTTDSEDSRRRPSFVPTAPAPASVHGFTLNINIDKNLNLNSNSNSSSMNPMDEQWTVAESQSQQASARANSQVIDDPFKDCSIWTETESSDDEKKDSDHTYKDAIPNDNNGMDEDFKSCDDDEEDENSYNNAKISNDNRHEEGVELHLTQTHGHKHETHQVQEQLKVKGCTKTRSTPSDSDIEIAINSSCSRPTKNKLELELEGGLVRLSDQGLNHKDMTMVEQNNSIESGDNIVVAIDGWPYTNTTDNGMTSNKKNYKSRILLNADNTSDSDSTAAGLKVEIVDGQVGIVTGRGTFLSSDCDCDFDYYNNNNGSGGTNQVRPVPELWNNNDTTNISSTVDNDAHLLSLSRPGPTNETNTTTVVQACAKPVPVPVPLPVTSALPHMQINTSNANPTDVKMPFDSSAHRRPSPEGQECTDESSLKPTDSMARSAPDGADKIDALDSKTHSRPACTTPVLEADENNSDDNSSTDSWTDSILFDEETLISPPPLDLTLHTIVEESSCEESEDQEGKPPRLNELERYYNFSLENNNYEESEFSDTFSESSLISSELKNGDPELGNGMLEKYFNNLGNSNSDSVGSESEEDGSTERRRKVLKHHRRASEEFSEDEIGFQGEGFDTIKKQRKLRKSSDDLLELTQPHIVKSPEPAIVSRSSSFSWSSDEEVNVMMSKLRHLVKNLVQNKHTDEPKDEKLVYLESELIRLMRTERSNISEDEDEDVYRLFEQVEKRTQPELLSKVMTHIGNRLNTWMKDEDEDAPTLRFAPSVSSDLNEDRFSWKGSFESALAKRQSVGSSDSLDCGAVGQELSEVFCDRSILRSSSLHHLANPATILEEGDSLTNSLPRLYNPATTINRAKSSFITKEVQVKSARYRPPGWCSREPAEHGSVFTSTPVLSSGEAHSSLTEPADSYSSRDLTPNIKVRGQIEISMQYDYKHSTFEIRVTQCRDLAAADVKRRRSDPYVKAYLLPDRTKSSKRKTKTKKNTLNPVFGETLKFPVSLEELENRSLWLSVWHSDLFGKNAFLGQIVLNLRSITFDDTAHRWHSLQDKSSFEDLDNDLLEINLTLALKWSSKFDKGDLAVLVKEAKGLKCVKNSYPSTFVKCTPLVEKSKKQKTGLCRKVLTPSWNTTLTFYNVSDAGIELSIYNYDLLNHELLGSVRLDGGQELWAEMLRRERFWVEGVVKF